MKKLILMTIVFSITLSILAQKLDSITMKPKLKFLEDTFLLGKPTPVSMSFTYPKHWQVIFPDTNYNYAPFEWYKKDYFPTQTQNNLSKDSAVFWLRSFEISPIQTIRLPVFLIQPKGDSLALFSNIDTIYFKQLIHTTQVDTLRLKADTTYATLSQRFNLHAWVLVFVSVFFFSVLIWLFSGAWIRKQILLLNLKRKQVLFEDSFEKELLKIRTRRRIKDIEQAFILWKKHLEQIEDKPYSTYTSSEIVETLPVEKLAESLQNIDRAIYGTILEDSLEKDFSFLKHLARERYLLKKQIIKQNN